MSKCLETKQIDHKRLSLLYLMFNGDKKETITIEESKDVEAIICNLRITKLRI